MYDCSRSTEEQIMTMKTSIAELHDKIQYLQDRISRDYKDLWTLLDEINRKLEVKSDDQRRNKQN